MKKTFIVHYFRFIKIVSILLFGTILIGCPAAPKEETKDNETQVVL